jgi:hypothetical protein
MATVINTTNVSLTELQTAPGGGSPGTTSFENSGRYGWNEGIQGSSTAGAVYTWGYGFGGGGGYADAIYGLAAPSTGTPPLELSDWRGLQYWFDGTTFNITLKWTNNLTPNPPGDFIDIQFGIADSSLNYSIFGPPGSSPPNYQFNANMAGGQSQAQTQIPGFAADQYVLVKNVYWFVLVNTGPNFPGGTVNMDINTTTVWNRGFPSGVTSNDYYDFSSRSADAFTSSSGIDIEVTVS